MRALAIRASTLAVIVAISASCGGGSSISGALPPTPPPGAQFLVEDFLDGAQLDAAATDADWAGGQIGSLLGAAITSRNAYIYGYPETSDGVTSGRGQYTELVDPLAGSDLEPVAAGIPPTSQGRRMLISIRDTEIGESGTITAIAWGPALNQTVAASYPDVKLRMGYQAATATPPPGLVTSGITANYAGTPTLLYSGPYTVTANADVGNTSGHPASAHIGGYASNPGCSPTWNAPLFTYTGWFAWPALTTDFAWDPGDPLVANDSVLLFDASVQAAAFHNRMRAWFAVTFPCSGILIGGYPEQMLTSTYEGDAPNPADNFGAGILNPTPVIVDTCLTLTRKTSYGQSLFRAGAFGDDTDYGPVTLVPATQSGAAAVLIEYQGADSVAADGVTINTGSPFTAWVTDIDQCDGMQNLRFRVTLISDLATSTVAQLDRLTIQMTDLNP